MTKLYDAFGRAYTPPQRPQTREVATVSIRDRWSTYPADGLTPERLAGIFKEADLGDVRSQSELFEQLEEKDTHLSSVLHTRKLALTGCELSITPASESAEDKTIAAFVEEAIAWIENWDEALLDLADAIGKGFAATEIRWELEGAAVWIRKLEWRHQKTFTFMANDRVLPWPRLLTDANPVWGEELVPWQWVVHRYKARSGIMPRAGLLRTCAWMALFKNYGLKDWVVFAEVYGMPLRLGKYDPGATKEDRDALIAAVRSLGTDAAGVISKATEIEFVEAVKGGQGNNVFELLTSFCNAEMSKAVLGQTLTTEIGQTGGAFAASRTHDAVRGDLLDADAKALSRALTMQIVRPLVGFNFGWDTALPELRVAPEEAEDLQAAALTYKTLGEAGFRGIPVKYIHEKFGIPEPKAGEETLAPAPTPSPFGPSGFPGPSNASDMSDRSEETRGGDGARGRQGEKEQAALKDTARRDELDPEVDAALEAAGPPMADLQAPVRALIATATSMEALRDGLINLHPDMDPTAMGNLLHRAFLLSHALGRKGSRLVIPLGAVPHA